ncbi:LamG domain-containing protein [Paenibacillus chungangensis]|uniref:LamG domain-containing protein n=1 Tax=Paenibacillus chungangensis TaxID=696535 RepID=A0ABW3HRQ5_9BACL
MSKSTSLNTDWLVGMEGLVSFWDFHRANGEEFVAKGPCPYRLKAMNGAPERAEKGVFGDSSLHIRDGQWLSIPRQDCPELNIYGPQAQLTVTAWVNRDRIDSTGCEFIAGIWNETARKRQYGMFLNLRIWDSAEQVCGHVSAVGGPTPGYQYCMTSSIGATPVTKGKWHFVAFTYDGNEARSYLDGVLDRREQYNPYHYPDGLFDGGEDGADFTVGAVDRSGEIGNFYNGLLGGLAVFNRALAEDEIMLLHQSSMGK